MKLTIRMPVIWQLNEMTCYGVQPKMLMPTRLIMIFLAVLFSLLTGVQVIKTLRGEYIRPLQIFVHQVRHQQEDAKSNIAYLIYIIF